MTTWIFDGSLGVITHCGQRTKYESAAVNNSGSAKNVSEILTELDDSRLDGQDISGPWSMHKVLLPK